MEGSRIARVRWYLGQSLLPEHLLQNEAQTAELRLATRMGGRPTEGIARLSWNEPLFGGGTVAITQLTCVFPGGTLVDVPGNAAVTPFSLEESGKARMPLYLHLTGTPLPRDGSPLYESDPKAVERLLYGLRLSVDPFIDDMVDTLRLADVEREVSGEWKLAQSYIPPALTVGGHPFLAAHVGRLKNVLAWYETRLRAQHTDSYASRERLAAVRRCYSAVTALGARLLDIEHGVDLAPYELLEGMRALYREICSLEESLPEPGLPPYQHGDLAACIEPTLQELERKVAPAPDVAHHAPFEKQGDVFRLQPLPDEALRAAERYLLVQRNGRNGALQLNGAKLASPSRLPLVKQLMLTGVPAERIAVPTFRHPFAANIDFHRLVENEEWEQATRERALVFYAPPELRDAKLSLFWRNA